LHTLIIVPIRELAIQVRDVMQEFSAYLPERPKIVSAVSGVAINPPHDGSPWWCRFPRCHPLKKPLKAGSPLRVDRLQARHVKRGRVVKARTLAKGTRSSVS